MHVYGCLIFITAVVYVIACACACVCATARVGAARWPAFQECIKCALTCERVCAHRYGQLSRRTLGNSFKCYLVCTACSAHVNYIYWRTYSPHSRSAGKRNRTHTNIKFACVSYTHLHMPNYLPPIPNTLVVQTRSPARWPPSRTSTLTPASAT